MLTSSSPACWFTALESSFIGADYSSSCLHSHHPVARHGCRDEDSNGEEYLGPVSPPRVSPSPSSAPSSARKQPVPAEESIRPSYLSYYSRHSTSNASPILSPVALLLLGRWDLVKQPCINCLTSTLLFPWHIRVPAASKHLHAASTNIRATYHAESPSDELPTHEEASHSRATCWCWSIIWIWSCPPQDIWFVLYSPL